MENSAVASRSGCTGAAVGVDAVRTCFLTEAEEDDAAVFGREYSKMEKSSCPKSD